MYHQCIYKFNLFKFRVTLQKRQFRLILLFYKNLGEFLKLQLWREWYGLGQSNDSLEWKTFSVLKCRICHQIWYLWCKILQLYPSMTKNWREVVLRFDFVQFKRWKISNTIIWVFSNCSDGKYIVFYRWVLNIWIVLEFLSVLKVLFFETRNQEQVTTDIETFAVQISDSVSQ